jgi:hypothetical protein
MDATLATQVVDPEKAKLIQPFFHGYYPNTYVSPGQLVQGEVESREMEVTILAAYDYGIQSLNERGLKSLQRFIDDVALRIAGKL